jgi:muconolactone delta-isomerase
MRYLISWKVLRIPPEMAKVALALLKASDKYTENLVKQGIIKELWAYADGSGGGCVGEGDSHEDAYKALMANPYTPFLEYTITPIIDFKLASDNAKETLKKFSGE